MRDFFWNGLATVAAAGACYAAVSLAHAFYVSANLDEIDDVNDPRFPQSAFEECEVQAAQEIASGSVQSSVIPNEDGITVDFFGHSMQRFSLDEIRASEEYEGCIDEAVHSANWTLYQEELPDWNFFSRHNDM